MDVETAIQKRHSTREFKDKNIPKDLLGKILDAGRLAPSSGNIQNWNFVIVIDEEQKKQLARACHNQLWMVEAPVLIVILADQDKARKFYGERGENLYSIQNCAMAAENMMLSATSLGVGSCFVSALVEEKVREIVSAPDDMLPTGVLALGFEKFSSESKPKASLFSKVSFSEYRNKIKDLDLIKEDFNLVGRSKKLAQKGIKKISKTLAPDDSEPDMPPKNISLKSLWSKIRGFLSKSLLRKRKEN